MFKPKNEVNNSLSLKAPVEKVWEALTQSDKVAQYMFGSMVQSSWEAGAPIEYYVEKDGEKKVVAKGKIVKIEKPKILEHTLFPAQSKIDDKPENYITVAYSLQENDEGCTLEISQKGFLSVEEGASRYRETKHGWKIVLPKLKKLVENS